MTCAALALNGGVAFGDAGAGVEHLLYGGRGVGGVGEEATESQVACFMSLLSTLAAVPEVLRISPRHEKVLHNAAAFKTIQSGAAGGTPFTDLGLDGTGEIIQVRKKEAAPRCWLALSIPLCLSASVLLCFSSAAVAR